MIAIPSVSLDGPGAVSTASRDARARRGGAAGLARELADLGFARLHVADGGATSSGSANLPALENLLSDTTVRVQVGGVTSSGDIEQLLRAGAELVVVGDRGIEEPEWLAGVADLYPEDIAVRTDVRDRRVVRRGWVRTLPVDILDLVEELNAFPLRELLVAMRPLDGGMHIAELALLEDVAERSRCPVLVAGGVATVHDLRALEHRGIAGAVIEAEKLLGGAMDGREIAQEFGA
jgi:phosphoribosylformimino-5-aminoimidazole carboxamide ribotide isomerase